ncbi:MAG: TonB-dependent receptor [Ignavibacteria bacterium]|jgi:hypothetical protein
MKHIVLILLLISNLISANNKSESEGSIIGSVIDSKTKEALIGVNIIILETNIGTATGENGLFQIDNLSPGTYRLKFSFIGYDSRILSDVIVNAARPAILNLELTPGSIISEEVTVTAGYFEEINIEAISSTSLSREEIRRFPGGFEDVVRTASTIPGVAVISSGGRNDLLVRGGGPSENLYLVNNIEIPNVNHFGNQGTSSGTLSFINLDFVHNVDFSTGGFGTKYGDKMSSVLSIDFRPGRTDRLGGKATISATQYGFALEGPVSEKGSFLFSARQSYLDLIFKAAGLAFVPVYTDFNFYAAYDFTPKDKLTLLSLTAIDRVERNNDTDENRIENETLMDNTQNQFINGINYRHVFKNGFLNATLNYNYNKYDFSQTDRDQVEYFKSDAGESETGFKLESYFKSGNSCGLTAGILLKRISNNNDTRFADSIYNRSGRKISINDSGLPQFIRFDKTASKHAAYIEYEHLLSDNIDINLGLRTDYYSFINEEVYFSPRISVVIKASHRLSFKLSAGIYHQSPSYVWTLNEFNKDLKALKNDMGIAGFEYLLKDDIKISVETYYKKYSDLPTGITPGTDYLVITNTGAGYGGREDDFLSFGYIPLTSSAKGKSFGAELLIQKKYSDTPLYGQISLAFNKSEYTAGNGLIYPGEYDQRFIFNAAGGYKFNEHWEVSGKFRFFTGAPYTPVYKPSENNSEIQNLPGEYLSSRLKNSHSLDIRVDRMFNFDAWTLIVFIDVQNVYNNKLPVKPSYDFYEDKIETTNSLSIIPSIGISAEF